MSPLILVGILVLTSSTLGDVHETDPNVVADAQEINRLAVQHNNGDYWWMNSNSPLKAAYDYYKKCAKKGNCLPPVNDDAPHQQAFLPTQHSNHQQIKLDINKNPFFNGQFQGVTDNPPNPNGGGGGAVQIDINKNPFFNGAITTGHGGSVTDNGQGFLGVQPSKPFFDTTNVQKKPGFASQHPLEINEKRQKCEGHNFVCVTKDLCNNGVVNNNGLGIIQDRFENYCNSVSEVCCQIVKQQQQQPSILPQRPHSDLSDEITAGKSSIPGATIKFSGATGLSPGFIQVLPDDSSEIKANVYNIGEIGHQASASSTKSTRATGFGPTIDYSNVKFDDVRFQSSIQGPAYLPPIDGPSPRPPQPPSTPSFELPPTISTYQPNLPAFPSSPRPFQTYPTVRPTYGQPSTTRPIVTTTTRKYVPPQTSTTFKYVPPTVQSTTQRPFIVTQPPTTTTTTRRPYQPSTQPTGTPYRPTYTTAPPTYGCIPSANNNYQCPRPTLPPTTSREYLPPFVVTTPRPTPPPSPTTTPRPYQPPSTTLRPYQPPSTTVRPYQPPTTTFRPYQPPSTTQRPYQPPPPPSTTVRPYQPPSQPTGYVYDRPTPSFELPTKPPPRVTSGTNINNQYVPPPTPKTPTNGYLPPVPNQQGDGSSINEANVPPPYIPPKRPPPPDNTGDETGNPPIFIQPNNTIVPAGCAAALKCVQEIYCTAEGVISAVPVTLTREQQINRVPTTDCQDEQSGVIGKCCRDPDYKDPWPSANLVNGVDDGQYKEDNNFGQNQQDLQRLVRSDRVGGPRQQSSSSVRNALNTKPVRCGQRNVDGNGPKAPGPLDVDFAEIPWQAMILRESNRSLLCGGAIIQRNAILTTAHCVDGIDTSDILIKGGEWKLGVDEEPLPFQIVKVATVIRHPQYRAGSLQNDLAVLVLQEKLRPAKNIGTICLPQPNQIPTQNCIVTGWGKRILQLHARGAIMHSINVNIMDGQQCQETLANKFQHALGNYSPNTLCGFSDIDQCKVDYGSALACQTGDNQYTLSGIFSWDTGCKGDGQIGGYIAPDVEWVQNTLRTPLEQLKQIENSYQQQQQQQNY